MVQKVVYSKISARIAEEKQLLAEEKWIIEALTKIRNQRNCLQIERLELESLKAQLLLKENGKSAVKKNASPSSSASTSASASAASKPSPQSAVKLMASTSTAPLTELEEALAQELEQEAFCNVQELNLSVTNPVLSKNYNPINFPEEEVDTDASEDSTDNNPADSIMIDMNMFMNGEAE